jgi:hypothetical protein
MAAYSRTCHREMILGGIEDGYLAAVDKKFTKAVTSVGFSFVPKSGGITPDV